MATTDEGESPTRSELWNEIAEDVRTTFGDAFDFEIEEYGEYIEVHLKPGDAVQELEARHDDLRIVPFNTCKMTIRRDK